MELRSLIGYIILLKEDGFFMRRFPTDKKNFLVDTNTGPWQEAVLDSENNPKVIDWAVKLISEYGQQNS